MALPYSLEYGATPSATPVWAEPIEPTTPEGLLGLFPVGLGGYLWAKPINTPTDCVAPWVYGFLGCSSTSPEESHRELGLDAANNPIVKRGPATPLFQMGWTLAGAGGWCLWLYGPPSGGGLFYALCPFNEDQSLKEG